jgi:hypothetical protein
VAGRVIPFPERRVDGEAWEPWVDEKVLARHFGVTGRTVRNWRAAGMPSRLIGGARRYKISDAESWHELQEAS